MNLERASVRLVVSSSNQRSVIIYSNVGTILIDNEYTAKKLAENILEQVSIPSHCEMKNNDEIESVVICANGR